MDNKAAWIIKIIFALLIIFIVAIVIIALRNISRPVPTEQTNVLQPRSGGKIALISDKAKYKVGENINVSVRFSTGGYTTDGTDLIIDFDPNLLEVTSSGITKGASYSDYPLLEVSNGKILVSGIADNTGFNGSGTLVNLTLKAKQTGSPSLMIDFAAGNTRDSNIIETKTGIDILNEVTNLKLVIDNDGSETVAGSCSGRVYMECIDSNGRSGSYWCSSVKDGFSCSQGCFKEKIGNELGCKVI